MKSRNLIPVVAVLFAAFVPSAPTKAQSLPSPVANFSFNNTYADATGALGNATAYGTYFTTNRFGDLNSAVGFSGSQYARISGLGSLLSGAPTITIAGWYLVNSGKGFPLSYSSGFIENTNLGEGVSPAIRLWVAGDPNNGIQGNMGRWSDVYTTTTFPMGDWAHLTMVLQENATPLIYMNGHELTWITAPANFVPITFASDYGVGVDIVNGQPFWATYSIGAVSDLKFYDDAFTAQQVQTLYNVESVPEPSTYALLLMTSAGALSWARRRR
jgi:hypothetical protein